MLKRERFLDILGSYMFVERREEKVEDAKGRAHGEAGDGYLSRVITNWTPWTRLVTTAAVGGVRDAQLPDSALGG